MTDKEATAQSNSDSPSPSPVSSMQHGASASPISDGQIRALEERCAQAEQTLQVTATRLALQYAVTSILTSSSTLDQAFPLLLETICAHLDWQMGAYWTMDQRDGALHCRALWHTPSLSLEGFAAHCRRLAFAPGIGLPGRVWASRQPALIPDLAHEVGLPRAPMAAEVGLHGAVGFPVQAGTTLHGVMEFFSHDRRELTADLVQALLALGRQTGSFAERVQADEARRISVARRATVLETALDSIITMDHTGRILEFNPMAEVTFGYSRAEVLGQEMAALIIPPDQREQHRRGLATYLATGEGPLMGRRLEVTAMRADGSLFPAEVAITRVALDGPPLFTGYIRDITERRQADDALRASEERFRLLFASNPLPMWVYDLETLAFLEVNEAAIDQYGYSRDEFLAMRITDMRPLEDVARLLEDLRRQRQALQRSGIWRHRRKDGQIIDVAIDSHTLTFAGHHAALVCARNITAQKRAEAALQASEERLRTVVTNAPIVLFAVDRHGVFTLSDGKGLELLGLQSGQHVGQSYFDLYGHLPDSVTAMKRALAGESATTINAYKGFVFETRWMPATDADGTITGAIGVSADITERTRAEQERAALYERERAARAEALERASQLEATFEAMTDAVFVFDGEGQVLHANAAVHTLFGLEPDYIARPVRERGALAMPRDEQGQPIPQAHWPSYRILRGEILTGGHAADVGVRTPDGRELQLNISGAPVRDDEGDVVGGIMVMRDVTERRRLERRTHEALQALLAMAHTLVSGEQAAAAPDAERRANTRVVGQRLVDLTRDVLGCRRVRLSTLDPQTGLVHPLAVAGLSPADEQAWWATREPSRLDLADPAFVARLLAGEVVLIDMTQPAYRDQPNPYGARVILATLLRVGPTPVGILVLDYGSEEHAYTPDELALVGAVAQLAALVIERELLLREHEEARASAAALREANRRMDEFLGIAGHEIRTPLTTISGHVQLAQRRAVRLTAQEDVPVTDLVGGLSAIHRLLDRADMGLTRLNRLVSDLLDVSRIQAGHLEVRLGPSDLATIVREVVDEHREMAPARTIHLRIVPKEPVPVNVDRDRIGQVLSNYLSNALKYSPPEQLVLVGLDVEGMEARVWVHDEGPGVPLADQERIWDRFYRVAGIEPQHGSSVGLGLGLHISRSIIERHGGQVGIESVPGAGATFSFTLPLAHPA